MPISDFELPEKYRYQCGFNSHLETEAVEGALPIGQNSPQKPPLGLYAEKLSGTAFTAPRHENKQTWLYRILPSCAHPPFEPATDGSTNEGEGEKGKSGWFAELREDSLEYVPNQIRWDPFDLLPEEEAEEPDFVAGLRPLAGAGDPRMKDGLGIYVYLAKRNMDAHSAFYSADGDMLIVPQQGALDIRTELGHMLVRPNEIAVVPRGVRYRVDLVDGQGGGILARGYALEIYHGHFSLPELGPIGSNGLANPRDFQVPVACFDEDYPGSSTQQPGEGSSSTWQITAKFANTLHVTRQAHTPFDVVAWQGLYYPFKYDLGRFNTIGSISYDHPDPSIFTVLSATGSGRHGAGTALADFVIFPPRWLVAEHSFRPPYFHRNVMAEFMGLIAGEYDAKKGGKGGFEPGGASLHNVMAGHGPDGGTVEGARAADPVAPRKVGAGGMTFMFETSLMLGVTGWGRRTCRKVQEEYSLHSWGGLKVYWEGAGDRGRREYLLK